MSSKENLAILYDEITLTLSTLAGNTAIVAASKIDGGRLNGFRVMKTEYWIDYTGKTGGEGPIMVGYTPTKSASTIKTCFDADPQSSIDPANDLAREPVFPLEMLPQSEVSTSDMGKIMKGSFTPKWSTPEGIGASWFAYNMDSSALTTGTVINIFAKHYGVWLRD